VLLPVLMPRLVSGRSTRGPPLRRCASRTLTRSARPSRACSRARRTDQRASIGLCPCALARGVRHRGGSPFIPRRRCLPGLVHGILPARTVWATASDGITVEVW
jgi:hypothetical protein